MSAETFEPVPVDVETMDMGSLSTLVRAEIDQQISTAKAYPRSIQKFMRNAESWSCLSEEVAEECSYAIPRDGKMIEGPSARMAEILVVSWENCRAGARVIEIGATMVRAQGYFLDLERNVAVAYEVPRRITNRHGKRFSDDMIVTTANAACSIAYRNAVFRGIPQAIWKPIWSKARLTAAGTNDTLQDRRTKAFAFLAGMGANEKAVLETLGLQGVEDVTLDHLATLKALINAVRDGELKVDEAFGGAEKGEAVKAAPQTPNAKGMAALDAALGANETPAATEPAAAPDLVLGNAQEGPQEPRQRTNAKAKG